MTPEREYLLVTEFFDGAEEIGDAEVDDDVIDQGLKIVRQLWDAGLAHRDIKPANLLVQNGKCSSSTCSSCRCDRHRGARRSTSPT